MNAKRAAEERAGSPYGYAFFESRILARPRASGAQGHLVGVVAFFMRRLVHTDRQRQT
jgi:hypothetical protein